MNEVDGDNAPSPPSSRRRFIFNSCVASVAVISCMSSVPQKANAIPSVVPITDDKRKRPHIINDSVLPQTLLSTPNNDNSASSITAFQESITGFVSGSAVSTVKTLVKYPLDTATVRLQMPNTQYAINNLSKLFTGSFDGITAPLLSNIPAGAIFFAIKDATKTSLKNSALGLPKWAVTSLAVAAALPPYWAIRNPSEVVKTRLQVGAEGYYDGMSTSDAFQLALSNNNDNSTSKNNSGGGVSELYQGYIENILYAFPADIIKFVAYDNFTGGKGKKNVSPIDGAVYGALSTAIAQLVTTPLDVLRNRIMAEVSDDDDDNDDDANVDDAINSSKKMELSYVDRLMKIAKEEGIEELFAGSTPRVAKAMLSGAIQFATYEETKQKMAEVFFKR